MNKKIGIAKRNIKLGETIISVDLNSNKIKSDVIKFLPYGKIKLIKKLCLNFKEEK